MSTVVIVVFDFTAMAVRWAVVALLQVHRPTSVVAPLDELLATMLPVSVRSAMMPSEGDTTVERPGPEH